MSDPFSSYMNPTTMTQRQSYQPQWGNVGYRSGGDPFGPNEGDISGKGWRNPLDIMAQQTEEIYAKMAQSQQPMGGPTGAMGSPNTAEWANVNRWDAAVQAAAQKYGVDPNRIKAHMRIESGGEAGAVQQNAANGNTYGLMQINPAIWSSTLAAQGIDMNTPEGNIMGAAYILADGYKRYGNWDQASSAFFLGNPNWVGADTANGNSGSWYQSTLNGYMTELSAAGGGVPGNANSVVQTATSFVGKVPYVWGGIPGKGATPTGWDCSGFTYWLDQNYGGGDLPAGSHYQYQYAQQTGRLRPGGQPQVGDLVFFNTGFTAGGGSNLNGASHVGMYIGNGQFVHAANETDGTVISDFNQYTQNYQFLGSMAMSWSGGGSYSAPMQGGVSGYGSGSLMGNWNALMDPNAPWRTYKR
jgi:cell wall-associated NlpC family hydrolase